MDVQKKLDDIVAAVAGARSMPMSSSCVIHRAELLALLEEVRQALPGSLAQAQELIGGRDQMVEQARQEAERIIESAHAQRGSLVSDTEVARRSQGEADRILAEARREAEEIRAEADDYVDSKLANFEVVLTKTIGSVDRGREKLLGGGPGLADEGYANADEYISAKLATFEAVLAKTLEAVGRGRQKLQGRVATDDLGAHMAAQDAAGVPQSRTAGDADFLAALAEPDPEPAGDRPQIPAQPEPVYDTYPGASTGSTGAAYAAQYSGQHQQPQQQDAYPYQDPYAGYQQQQHQQQPEPGYEAYAYQQQPDPYAAYQQPQQAQQPQHPQQPALDETSFFDTSMINLDQLRQYEQGR
ncbi:cell division initiation protein [Streptomyces sp. NPDC051211]|uniref:cell division initiation protein n=1 Tax=Streptomyces sp. NPDC051211 TaxID=3154643 RepID=UPI00344F491C